ncbi:MAG: N-acetyltransferase [Chloroflexota bacterium]|nr:N-acetyltransferase [Chloroflexota bacterium]
MTAVIRPAMVDDGVAIYELVNYYAQQGLMLPKSQSAVYESIRDFLVAEQDGKVVGCGALQITWQELGEVRSLAISDGCRRRGIGRRIVERLLKEAGEIGLARVFALTHQRDFFLSLGFHSIEKKALPQKIWIDCINCVKFPNCDAEAVIINLEEE